VSIGETLAQARLRAGLSVSDVSQRTRIRETLIRAIESDDYSGCGGDFYARGHIRSIARVVGTDPEPLIREYDAARQPPSPAATGHIRAAATGHPSPAAPDAAPSVPQAAATAPAGQAATTGRIHPARPRPRPLTWAVALILVAALGSAASYYLAGAGRVPEAALNARPHRAARHPAAGALPGAPGAATSKAPAPTTRPRPARPARLLVPVSATAFGVGGPGQGDNPQLARYAIDGNPATAWHTDWYTSPRFGNLYPGTGLLLDLGHRVTVTSARLLLGRAAGAAVQLRVGDVPSLAALRPVARSGSAAGLVRLRPAHPAAGRYVLIWFTRLPPDSSGTFQASIYEVTLRGRP
jgi:transcriptional regulator with XRE-family HTH domain